MLKFCRSQWSTTFGPGPAQGRVHPIPIKRADGVYFWDVDGKRYLDLNSMVMCVNIGHGNQRVIEAMVDQVRELPLQALQWPQDRGGAVG